MDGEPAAHMDVLAAVPQDAHITQRPTRADAQPTTRPAPTHNRQPDPPPTHNPQPTVSTSSHLRYARGR